MVIVRREGILLKPRNLEFEKNGVLNPACIKKGNNVHMFYRAVNSKMVSSICYCKLEGAVKVVERSNKPILEPEFEYESHGIEDPRIVEINGTYYMTYTAYDGKNVRIAYATSKNLKDWKKQGIISPDITYDEAENIFRKCSTKLKERYFLFESYFKDIVGKDVQLWNKDAILFPKKIKGKFALLYRVLPDIQIAYFKNFKDLTLDFWKEQFKSLSDHVLLESQYSFESRNIGGGCPPIETKKGWLLIYHAVDDMDRGKIYRGGIALLDKNDPQKVIYHPSLPFFSPMEGWEKQGVIKNVVFPTGAVIFGNRLYVYYGAADKYIGVLRLHMDELLHEIVQKQVQFIECDETCTF
ncbi:MAG: pesticidal protein Cry7Aa [Candidatus Woesearchaeota archaeon]